VAVLVADGYDAAACGAACAALAAARAVPLVVGTKRAAITARDGRSAVRPDHHLEGLRSTAVDALFVPGGAESVTALAGNGRALHWIREAFGHLKVIGATGEAVGLVERAVGLAAVKTSGGGEVCESYGVVTVRELGPGVLSEAVEIEKGAEGFMERFFYLVAGHRCWQRELDGLSAQVAY
jgi:catalase